MEAHIKDAVEQRAELEEHTWQALNKVCEDQSVWKAAAMFGIPKATLRWHYSDYKNLRKDQKLLACLLRKHCFVAVFSPNEEATFGDLLDYGFKHVLWSDWPGARKVAYQYVLANNKKVPQASIDNAKTRKEWMYHFWSQSPTLLLRKTEATSLSQATSFNLYNANQFFGNLYSWKKQIHCIWYL